MQLVAYGAQDIYLTGNPMITYFKVVYRRHTNFAMESILQTFSGTVGYGKKVTALISRNGDLVNGMLLEITIPAEALVNAVDVPVRYIRNIGHVLVKQVEVEIGGQLIDRHYSDWLEIWSQLTVTASKIVGYRNMIGQSPIDANGAFTGLQATGAGAGAGARATSTKVYAPLQFWFCRNVGLALPLIALQYHEVKVNITFADKASVLISGANVVPNNAQNDIKAELWVDYIYLDTDERRRFAQVSHEYLIEQLQFTGDESFAANAVSKSLTLNFNHPVKELVWVYNNTTNMQAGSYVNVVAGGAGVGAGADVAGPDNFAFYGLNSANPVATAKLLLNGHDRFAERDGEYFSLVQPNAHHTCIPGDAGINVYSFALKPEDHQPSGTCNFSRIDNAKLNLTFSPNNIAAGVIKVFATNYNVLRIMSGMGGLAYSN